MSGVPESTPELFRDSPDGSVPVDDQENEPLPPDAEKAKLNCEFTGMDGGGVLLIVTGAAFTVMVIGEEAVVVPSVTETVKE